ncbi:MULTISPECIES: DnaJ domain-containing protein [unclassified Erythrobacter]|jgi:DnaJ homolog subfamily C member 19|uniref:DnaJ domain-containing protein n=1 Tax=Erythrobacteraceae TaxID=335929 RepID=UPI00076BDE2D|nr:MULTISPECIES: DnaJ domain-containing protein [unclassified Erythrobacter]KWV94754.1 molecular chaperone DnaJ [Erythrobacter sp. AP23]MBO6767118.1 DnaJ domain-containing protein [Erythrobacter sp.]
MIRLLALAILLCVACRWIFGKWPWEYLRAQSPADRSLARARAILDVSPRATPDEIRAAHRRIATINHPDRGGSATALQEANAARDLLLDHLSRTRTEPPE